PPGEAGRSHPPAQRECSRDHSEVCPGSGDRARSGGPSPRPPGPSEQRAGGQAAGEFPDPSGVLASRQTPATVLRPRGGRGFPESGCLWCLLSILFLVRAYRPGLRGPETGPRPERILDRFAGDPLKKIDQFAEAPLKFLGPSLAAFETAWFP